MDRAFGGLGWQIVGWLVDAAGGPGERERGCNRAIQGDLRHGRDSQM